MNKTTLLVALILLFQLPSFAQPLYRPDPERTGRKMLHRELLF